MSRPLADLAVRAAALALAARSASAQPVRPYRPEVDVLDYHFAITLPDTGRGLRGRATVRFVRTAPTDTLVLDLVGMRVRAARAAGAAGFRQDSATVRVALPPHAPGDTLEAVVDYDGVPTDGLIVSRDSLGRWQAFGDDWPDRARHWLPVVDHPSDKATVTWTVTAPAARTIVANGVLQGVVDSGGVRTATWRESHPLSTDVMVIAAAPLARTDLGETACGMGPGGGCVPQAVYTAPEDSAHAPGAFRDAGEIVRWFSTVVAPFPYEKLAHLQSSTRFGGMENATAIFYADQLFRRATPGRGIIAHETAHQWFGDAVTERTWAHLWLSEGFATYWSALFTRHVAGDSAFRAEMAGMRAEVLRSPVTAARPVVDTAERQYLRLLNTNSYQKGAWTLHMLRGLVGDSAFFRGVRAYWLAHRDGTAVTDDLRRAVEASAGAPLDWFFREWLDRPGYVDATLTWWWDPCTRAVRIEVTQGTRWPPYRFPLDIEVVDADGTTSRVTVEVPAEARSEQGLPSGSARSASPRALRADPDVRLLGAVRVVRMP